MQINEKAYPGFGVSSDSLGPRDRQGSIATEVYKNHTSVFGLRCRNHHDKNKTDVIRTLIMDCVIVIYVFTIRSTDANRCIRTITPRLKESKTWRPD